jgi:hypothetical protein
MKNFFLILLLLPVLAIAQDDYYQEERKPVSATYDDVVSKKIKGKIATYVTQSGESFRVGDTITLGTPFGGNEFTFINQNAVVQAYPLEVRATGSRVRIKSMNAITKKLQVMCTHADGYTYQTFIIDFEKALQNGEVKSNQMSSDEALQELKKCKDKLDLGLITQEQFEAKKAELAKFIK